jgi:hypothetical protein
MNGAQVIDLAAFSRHSDALLYVIALAHQASHAGVLVVTASD